MIGPAVEFAPVLRQSNRLYFPDPHLLLGDNDGWTDTGSITVPLSAFSNSTGVPLNPTLPTYVGFVVRYIHPAPTTLTAQVVIDNVNIEVIPSPAAWLVAAAAAPLATRRRRPAASPR